MNVPAVLEKEVERFGIQPAWEVALLFPTQGDWSEAEYLALDVNRHVEFTDGVLEVLPFPIPAHQGIVSEILLALGDFVEIRKLGRVVHAPFPIRLRAGCFRQPDIAFTRTENSHRHTQQYWAGADLVVEVLSGDNEHWRERDSVRKRADYALAGVAEYWIADPVTERITVLVLDGAAYRTHGEFGRGEQAGAATLPGFAVEVAVVFDAAR